MAPARKWLCEQPTPGLSERCTIVAKIALLEGRRHLCAYHAWEVAHVHVTRRWWQPGELVELLDAAERAR